MLHLNISSIEVLSPPVFDISPISYIIPFHPLTPKSKLTKNEDDDDLLLCDDFDAWKDDLCLVPVKPRPTARSNKQRLINCYLLSIKLYLLIGFHQFFFVWVSLTGTYAFKSSKNYAASKICLLHYFVDCNIILGKFFGHGDGLFTQLQLLPFLHGGKLRMLIA